jgi:hypothetical protein
MHGLALPIRFFDSPALCALPAMAQFSTGDVLGTVTDSSVSVVVGAEISLTSKETGATRTVTSDSSGNFLFSIVQPGHYSLKVAQAGFSNFVIDDFVVSAGERVRQLPSLKAGGATETVEVTSSSPSLQTDTSFISSSVTEKQAAELPLNG